MNIVTQPHKVQPSRYALHLLRLWLRRNAWWAFGLPVVVALILAMFVDSKFLYLAVVMVCLVLPHVFVSVYWRHLLSDRTCRWLLPHTVTITDSVLTVDYVRPDDEAEADDEEKPLCDSFSVARTEVTAVKIVDDIIVINVGLDPYHIIILPLSVFDSADSYREFVRHYSNSQ